MLVEMIYIMSVYLVVSLLALFYFNRYLNCFFECRAIPEFWKFFFWGVSFFWVSDALLPIVNYFLPFESFEIFSSIMQPIGPVLALYAVYMIEEDARNA